MASLARAASTVSTTCTTARWLPTVGLEIHAQILSRSKLFSDGSTESRNKPPNTTVSLFDVALPGTLPVLNVACVRAGVRTALAVGADINMTSFFDRKHYFYPDLPAGYQITQKRVPLATGGSLMVPLPNSDSSIRVRLKQLQLEQDSGKIAYGEIAETGGKETLIDYNRAGIGLMEIVTEPDLCNGSEAVSFVRELRQLLLVLGTCDGNIQDGSLRVDANVSIRRPDSTSLGTRTEIKNVSGFRALNRAINYEISRHIQVLEDGGEIEQETRSFDEKKGITMATRGKTEQQDYCFMAEHDLPPLILYSDSAPPPPSLSASENEVINISRMSETIPELPAQLRRRLCQQYGLSPKQVQVLMAVDGASSYFEEVLKCTEVEVSPVSAHSWVTTELYGILEEMKIGIADCPVSVKQLSSILGELNKGNISGSQAKKALKLMANGDKRLAEAIAGDMDVLTEEEMELECTKVLKCHPEQVSLYCSGKSKVLGYFVGQVMMITNGRGDPQSIRTILLKKLNQS